MLIGHCCILDLIGTWQASENIRRLIYKVMATAKEKGFDQNRSLLTGRDDRI
ncbi:MAG: hypothetical protein KDC31_02480 [Saprospiraceae bacterium]|nr:hypothetical protein [Candidatus Parvibacillus calidus]MBX2938349.1 hypothetical protein [Saprospiraceae bacterium]MCB0590131.1 hypothetical protein [Saprospiraceae bacterium]MCC7148719.1 hypothetical protein [Saprospiraceae bacterium]MCO6469928.1 hypothetical protein [Saprospiraceae bacterium]